MAATVVEAAEATVVGTVGPPAILPMAVMAAVEEGALEALVEEVGVTVWLD